MFFTDGLDRSLRDTVGDHQIGIKRQMRAVLLDCPERLNDDAVLVQCVVELRCAKFGESP